MKTKSVISSVFLMLLFAVFSNSNAASAQSPKEDWKQKMMSERIAFLTAEVGITPEEAQVFWPVYNQIWKEKDEATKKVFKTFMELEKATKEGRSNKEISRLLDEYLQALDGQRGMDIQSAERIKKVLPLEKVAKLYIAEENFRRQQINRLHEIPGAGQRGGQANK